MRSQEKNQKDGHEKNNKHFYSLTQSLQGTIWNGSFYSFGVLSQKQSVPSRLSGRSFLTRCPREAWERAGERCSRLVSVGDVTAHGRVQD